MADEPLKVEPVVPVATAAGAIAATPAPAAEPGAPAAPVPAPAPTAAPAEAAPQHPSEIPSLLEGLVAPGLKPAEVEAKAAPTAEAPKPAEGDKKPIEAKPEAAKPVEPKAVEAAPAPAASAPTPIVVADLKLPDGFKAVPEQMEGFATLLAAADLPPMERAQKLLDMHTTALKEYAAAYDKAARENQVRVFNDMRADWRKEIMADSQIGGAGYQTASGAIARMRDMFVSRAEYGSPEWNADMKDMVDFLRTTGAGDHKAFHRLLHNVARAFDEPGMPPPNPRPPLDVGKNPNKPNGLRGIYKSSTSAQR